MTEPSPSTAARAVVLFVDDEVAVLHGFRDAFRREPYEVVTAPSAATALEILAKQRVDVVVSDECMPRVPGSEFLAIVRQRYPEIVRIMLTGEASLGAATRAIGDGLYRFLSKPIRQDELRRVLGDALRIKGVAKERAQLRRNQGP